MFPREECDFIDITTDEDIEHLKSSLNKDHDVSAYLRHTVNEYLQYPVFTSNFNTVTEKCKEERHVSLEGPKGCGKTFIVVVMFILFWVNKKPCLFLSPKSFEQNESCKTYFRAVVDANYVCGDDNKRLILDQLDNYNIKEAVDILIRTFPNKKHLMIFADLSLVHSMDKAHLLIDILKQYGFMARILLSLSSGIRHYTNLDHTKVETLHKFLVQFHGINITTGFTDDEASKYIEKRKFQFTLNQVRHISGTNPFLLSLIRDSDTIDTYQSTLDTYFKRVLITNLKCLGLNVNTIEEYFLNEEMLKCRLFAYYAIREDSLTGTEIAKYEHTWLRKYNLTVLDKVPFKEVTEDSKDDSEDVPEVKEIIKNNAKKQILRWNFPIMGTLFIEILTNFVTQSIPECVAKCCDNVPSFAGFWYEVLFFKHHQGSQTTIIVDYTDLNSNKGSLQLDVGGVAKLNPQWSESEPKPNVLFELRANHPIVDAVGLLKGSDGKQWLVFIQVSLIAYKDHRSLIDLFHRPPKGAPVHQNISYFSHYRRLFKLPYEYPNVLILYISPKEKPSDSPLEKLKEEITNLKTKHLKSLLKWGVLSKNSSFMTDQDVKEYLKKYF